MKLFLKIFLKDSPNLDQTNQKSDLENMKVKNYYFQKLIAK